ncbi:transferrin receptor-like dimerization domain-containing protein [Leeuwenhoekiella palythoae]|uniref:N-acetylated-alpha-linked acidic dipeptidase n=1 Tax=Leeuwenhoekiella palythoae TaxID=573501 RepID=A0A1M5TII2_9FLAO|nr:transferrin receptor-like dimerization domain-containing protein [Leeuwenhoekiella palythoae]RXG28649.1 N-acetylated-alpha-linked acidic dipeptidase [Leeuwenhoekiella palythoae]SHH50516.1 N-acetylated-alpha-linked acidic dipeptidase [Leeuwenhoekiella palythoae]
MKKQYVLLLLCVWSQIALAQTIQGFTTKSTQDQLALETQFDAKLQKENLDEWMQFMAAEPHYVGTEYGKKNAEWMKKQFESWGYDVEIDEYQVLFPYPKLRLLELMAPTAFKAALTPEPIAEDKYTQQGEALLPSYNAFSTDGDVTAELVFVNYGVPKDYEELEKLGIDVKGKIVIAKYYGSWRGIKPKLAAEKGAIGCIIYSDPADDGYVQGDVYPEGAFKPETGVQRGSVMDMPLYPGDVLTPGYGATKNAKRLDRKEAPTITKIPVLPISYADAQPFLEALNGPVAPSAWRGGLPITYHIGPGPAKVHLKLEFDWQLKPAYNVIAKLKGAVYPEEWVMRGNHHDAWVHGASDPVSGMVALMEEARAVGELAKAGQQPKRTIVYCAWDAEEPGLIGSTEWVEDHQEVLKDKAVVYINTDGNGRGFLGVGGSHTLETMVKEIAGSIEDPQTGVSLVERRAAAAKVANRDTDFRLSALGSGSDYTPFIQHTGIPSLNLGFGGESSGGEYHTIFDTYSHYTRFKDPGFHYGITLAKTAGHITLRMANADILPFEMNAWYKTVSEYMDEVTETAEAMRKQAEKQQQLVAENAYVIAADPKDNLKAPEAEKDIPYLDFSPLQNALASVKSSVHDFSKTDFTSLSASKQKMVNAKLKDLEKALLSESGLPRRPWFKHQIYAPGFYTGYGVKTLPGVREAIEQKNFEEAQEQIEKLAKTLTAFKGKLDEIVKMG